MESFSSGIGIEQHRGSHRPMRGVPLGRGHDSKQALVTTHSLAHSYWAFFKSTGKESLLNRIGTSPASREGRVDLKLLRLLRNATSNREIAIAGVKWLLYEGVQQENCSTHFVVFTSVRYVYSTKTTMNPAIAFGLAVYHLSCSWPDFVNL